MSSVEGLEKAMPIQLAVAPPPSDWCDVTELFSAATKELKVGQLIHVHDFNLFDSMSALELMDPKMDAGLLLHGAAPLSVSERIQQNAVPLEFTSARDVLATIDQLFRVEAAWINGQPLPQTLLTCVYMHRDAINALLRQLLPATETDACSGSVEERVTDRLQSLGGSTKDTLLLVMATLCAFTLRTCSHTREIVVRADIYEEEDFSPGAVNSLDVIDLRVWTTEALELVLMHAIQRVEELLAQERASVASKGSSKKSAKKRGNKAKTTATADAEAKQQLDSQSASVAAIKLEGLHSTAKISALLCEALLRRLQLRKVLHVVYSEIGLAEHTVDLEMARVSLASAQALLQQMAAEALEFDVECFSGKPFGFDKTLSRLLMSGSPPRDIKPTPMDEAIAIYQKLVSDVVVACSPGEWTMMEHVRIFLADFSRRKANIISRSLVLLLLYCDKKIYGKHSFMDWMTEEMVMNGVPSVLLSTQEGVQYSSRAIETLYESLKVYLHNRSRQRARIEYLLEEWAVLQLEAVAVDERFMVEMQISKAAYPRYFTAWSLEQVTVLMIQYVLLGFELELYAHSEHSTIYWYLDYLCGSRLQNLTFTWSFLERMNGIMKDHPRRGGKSSNAVDASKTRFQREISYMETLRSVMRAYFQMFAAFERDDLVAATPPVYGLPVIRFQHRFAAFQSLQFPATLTYDDYLKNSDFSQYGVDLIYKSAEECFKVARVHSNQTRVVAEEDEGTATAWRCDEVQQVVDVAAANLVHLARREQDQLQLQKSMRRGAKASGSSTTPTVEFDFAKHPHFPVFVFGTNEKR